MLDGISQEDALGMQVQSNGIIICFIYMNPELSPQEKTKRMLKYLSSSI